VRTRWDGWLEDSRLRARSSVVIGFLACCERIDLGDRADCCCAGSAWLLFELLDQQPCPGWRWHGRRDAVRGVATYGDVGVDAPVEFLLPGGEAVSGLGSNRYGRMIRAGNACGVVWSWACGRAVSRLLGELPCTVFWLDSRPAFFLPSCRQYSAMSALSSRWHLPANACWLVMTDSDQLDFDWIEQILLRGDARFIGLLGCRSKLASFNLRLISRVPLGVLPVFTALWVWRDQQSATCGDGHCHRG
jgi:xanthine dehydrogenase accessory factor